MKSGVSFDGSSGGQNPPFPLGRWWMDDAGNMHDAGRMDATFDEIFISQLGHIKVIAEPESLSISWDVRCVENEAIHNLMNRLQDYNVIGLIKLNFVYFGWVEEKFSNYDTALSRMLSIQAHRDVDVIDTTMMVKQPLENLESASPMIQAGYGHWSKSSGKMAKLSNSTVAHYLPHLVMFYHDHKDQDILYFWIGTQSNCMKIYGEKWAQESIGTISTKSTGPETNKFGDQISNQIDHVLDTGEPSFHHIR